MEKSKVIKHLPENRMKALQDLHINPTHKKGLDESPAFLLYLNYAVNTICDITEINRQTNNPWSARCEIKNKGKETIRKLANFFWLFNEEDPERDFPEYENRTLDIAEKIYDLRNYFAHLNESGSAPLVMNHDMYVFIEGILGSRAIENALKPGLRTAKLFNMSLAASHDKELKTYEFTRKGLIFFICLSLYKDDAMEFTQCLEDMKLPNCPKNKTGIEECLYVCTEDCASKPAAAKALIETFTYYSARRGRSVTMLEKNLNYLSFADISGYLNKVPPESMEYLTLSAENSKLQVLAAASGESEENKEYKYKLHKRFKNRFLSFSAGFCEDFSVLPSLKFKRLDISDCKGRKKYFFGTEHDNRVHMDRHFQIEKNAIRFAWEPKSHYGPIHIDSLRSTISSSAMKEILYAYFNGGKANEKINEYFTAYHRILETILNTEDPDNLYLEEGCSLLKDFETISGVKGSDLLEDLSPLERYFPQNLIRFFTRDENIPTPADLKKSLLAKLIAMWDHAADFVNRLEKLESWKAELGKLREEDPEAKLAKPVCSAEDVIYPPRTCDISDASLIAWVFRYFNLFLDTDRKFRQLPVGEQHRGGIADHEYQMVHAIIGRYALDPQGLKFYITKHRPELLPALEKIHANMRKDKARRKSLSSLALAAAYSYIDFCSEKHETLEKMKEVPADLLKKECRKFGIRTGMPLDRTALLKTVLHLDLAAWMNAYDYSAKKKYEKRSLQEAGHVVSQIPFPNDFAQRIMLGLSQMKIQNFVLEKNSISIFDFNKAFRAMETEICARDFYDTRPLVAASMALKKNSSLQKISGLNYLPDKECFPADFSQNAVAKAIREIKETANQDKILLKIASAYWQNFQEKGTFLCTKDKKQFSEKPSIYDYFDAGIMINFPKEQNRKIRIMPNNINQPVLSQIISYAAEIAAVMDPEQKQTVFDFYEMLKTYRVLQAKDRRKRLDIILYINLFAFAVEIPKENYEGKTSEEKRNMEFSYYQKKFRGLTRDEFEILVNCRNKVFHRGLNLETEEALNLLKKYVKLPAPASSYKKQWSRW